MKNSISLFFLLISFLFLVQGILVLDRGGEESIYLIGGSTVLFILSVLFMLRSKGLEQPRKTPVLFKVVTVSECKKCNFKSLREFKRDDYIMKKDDKCPVCSGIMQISSIYQETKKGPIPSL